MDSDTRNPDAAAAAASTESDAVCRRDPPTLVALDHVPETAVESLAACAERACCRLFAATDGHPGAFVVAGYPEDLQRLAMLTTPIEALKRVRETVSELVGDGKDVDQLPAVDEGLYQRREVAEAQQPDIPEGTTLLVTREFTFDAAHNLPRYVGKCERLHGHSYRVRVTVKAPLDPWTGLAFDFHDIKKTVNERVVKLLDHRYLNEYMPNPSAEHLAIWSWERLEDLPLHEIQVWETPNSFVTYHGPPRGEAGTES